MKIFPAILNLIQRRLSLNSAMKHERDNECVSVCGGLGGVRRGVWDGRRGE